MLDRLTGAPRVEGAPVAEIVSAQKLRTTWRLGVGAIGITPVATLGPDVVQHLAAMLLP